MARTVTSVQSVSRTGAVPTYGAVDAVNHNQFTNDGRTFIHVKNGGGAPINVTVGTPGTVDSLAVADLVVSVTNASEKMIGPFPKGTYDQTGGGVYVDWSSGSSVTYAVLKLVP